MPTIVLKMATTTFEMVTTDFEIATDPSSNRNTDCFFNPRFLVFLFAEHLVSFRFLYRMIAETKRYKIIICIVFRYPADL